MSTPQLVTAWASSPVPRSVGVRHTWHLTDLRRLSALRRQARTLLTETGAGDAYSEAVDRAVLVTDELVSNALRHGTLPATVRLSDQGSAWLVVVTDSAPHALPTPAVDRPAGQGGYGLHVVTDLALARGIALERAVKHVWALLPKT